MKNRYVIAAIGLGCALASMHAAAQSNVTMYGLIDLGFVKESGGPAKLSPGYNNWLGLRGSEDLGRGLAATFNIETRFTPNNGQLETGVFWQGESTVGLKQSGVGTLRLGRAQTPLWQQKWVFEPWWASGVNGSLSGFQTGSYASDPTFALNAANFARVPNAVFLDSESFGGFSAHFSGQVQRDTDAASRNMSVGAKYVKGDLSALIVHEKNRADDRITLLSVSYTLGSATLMGSLSAVKLASENFTEKNYLVAAAYTMGSSTIRGGVGKTTNELQNQWKVSVGYVYALSKRTSLYADLYRTTAATSTTGTALGINHSF